MAKLSEKNIRRALAEVLDPELNISIVDLGLVYKVKLLKNGNVHILMTLTTIGCPLFSLIEDEVKAKLKKIGVTSQKLKIELTWDPPWNMDRMSPKAKAMLGI